MGPLKLVGGAARSVCGVCLGSKVALARSAVTVGVATIVAPQKTAMLQRSIARGSLRALSVATRLVPGGRVLLATAVLPYLTYRWARWQYASEMRKRASLVNGGAATLIAQLDSPDLLPVDEGERFEPPPPQAPFAQNMQGVNRVLAFRFAAVLAREVKCKMGTPKRTRANWIVAQELVNKAMAERFVRKVDRIVFGPIATQMVFIPSRYEVVAKQMAHSEVVGMRHEEFSCHETTFLEWIRAKLFGRYPARVPSDDIERA